MAGWSAAASAAASFAGDYFGGKSAARDQFKYQKRMYQHRYQWQVKDLKAAGLNPMLSYMNPAPVPGSVSAPDLGNIGSNAVSSATKAVQAKAAQAQIGAVQAQESLTREQATAAEYANIEKRADPKFQEAVRAGQGEMDYRETSAAKMFFADVKIKEAGVEQAAAAVREAVAKAGSAEEALKQSQIMNPLLEEMQRFLNKAEKLGLSEKEATSALYENFKGAKGAERFMPLLLEIIKRL